MRAASAVLLAALAGLGAAASITSSTTDPAQIREMKRNERLEFVRRGLSQAVDIVVDNSSPLSRSSSSSSSASQQQAEAEAKAAQQALASLPTCAKTCMATAIAASPCSATDLECQCTNPALLSSTTSCIASTCTVEQALSATNTTLTLCGAPIRDRSQTYNIISSTLMAVACAIVVLRLVYTQFFVAASHRETAVLRLDDWFILLTLIVCVPSAVINVRMLSANGLGRDIWTLTTAQITEFAMGFWIITMLYFAEVFVLKLALLFFYLRIFPSRGVRRLLWATVAFDVAFGVAFIVTAVFQCWPVSYNWTSWKGDVPGNEGECANVNAIAWANAGVSIALDLWMLALPLWQLRHLKLNWRKKVGVAMMFFVGTFVTVVSMVRLNSLITFHGSANLTWDYWGVSLWSTVEITIGVICACMPTLRLILIRVAPKVFGTTVNSRYGGPSSAANKYYVNSNSRSGGGGGAADPFSSASRGGGSAGLKISRRTSVRITEDDSDSQEGIMMDHEAQQVWVGGGGVPLRSMSRSDKNPGGVAGITVSRVDEELESGGRPSTSQSSQWPL